MDVRNGKTQVIGAKPKPSIRKIQLYYMFISSEDDKKKKHFRNGEKISNHMALLLLLSNRVSRSLNFQINLLKDSVSLRTLRKQGQAIYLIITCESTPL